MSFCLYVYFGVKSLVKPTSISRQNSDKTFFAIFLSETAKTVGSGRGAKPPPNGLQPSRRKPTKVGLVQSDGCATQRSLVPCSTWTTSSRPVGEQTILELPGRRRFRCGGRSRARWVEASCWGCDDRNSGPFSLPLAWGLLSMGSL